MQHNMHLLSARVDLLLSIDPSLGLKGLARTIGTDRHNIERAIRERYGLSFRELKKRHRLKRALALLKEESGRYVKEIAAEVGVTPNHLSYFIRAMTGRCATDLRSQKS